MQLLYQIYKPVTILKIIARSQSKDCKLALQRFACLTGASLTLQRPENHVQLLPGAAADHTKNGKLLIPHRPLCNLSKFPFSDRSQPAKMLRPGSGSNVNTGIKANTQNWSYTAYPPLLTKTTSQIQEKQISQRRKIGTVVKERSQCWSNPLSLAKSEEDLKNSCGSLLDSTAYFSLPQYLQPSTS